MKKIGFLGYGEAGQAMAKSLLEKTEGLGIFAFDIAWDAQKAANHSAVTAIREAKEFTCSVDLIISVVTADQSIRAAESIAPFLSKGQYFIDGNSVSPGTKRATADIIHKAGAIYIDMAIMAPILPAGHQTAILLAGAQSEAIRGFFSELGFNHDWEGEEIGSASVVKMLRSVLIKGVESLICESMAAAEGLGLSQRILTSAGKTLGIDNMVGLADYVMERVAVHGRRRSAEMAEVAKTLQELGLSNDMAAGCANHQGRIADMTLAEAFEEGVPQDHLVLSALIRARQLDGQK